MLLASTLWSGVEPQLESNMVQYSLIKCDPMAAVSTKLSFRVHKLLLAIRIWQMFV